MSSAAFVYTSENVNKNAANREMIRNSLIFRRPEALFGPGMVEKRGLKIHPSQPPPNVTLPKKVKLPILSKVPPEFSQHFIQRIPKGTRENYRMMGEEMVHNDLIMGQFGIVTIHGGLINWSTFETIRNYVTRKLNAGKSFAFWRVDPPYKVQFLTYKNFPQSSCKIVSFFL